ncbi:MAG: universal stress protein [Bacteroidia bacterium]
MEFKNILCPFDGSVQSVVALKSAVFFAKKFHAHLTVVHIDESKISNEEIKTALDLNTAGLEYSYLHKQGRPYKGIVEAAKETDANAVIMGTHGISGFEEFWMGSNAYKVVHMAHCPVLTMRENIHHNDFRNIVLPIDTSFETRQKVPLAIDLAKKFDSTIHVIGVSVDHNHEAEHKILLYFHQIKKVIEEEGIKFSFERKLGGNITNVTIDYAKKVNADLIIIMTEQENLLSSIFLGKFAQQMVNHSTIPVFSVAPRSDLLRATAGY